MHTKILNEIILSQ